MVLNLLYESDIIARKRMHVFKSEVSFEVSLLDSHSPTWADTPWDILVSSFYSYASFPQNIPESSLFIRRLGT